MAASLRRLRLRSAYLLNSLGDSTGQAILAAKPAAADCEQSLRADHPDTPPTARTNLAYAYQAAGRTAEAIPLYEQTLAARERVLGADRPLTLLSRTTSLTPTRLRDIQPRRSRSLSRPSPASSGSWAPTTATPWAPVVNLAGAYEAAGRTAKAIPLLEQTLADFERVLGLIIPALWAAATVSRAPTRRRDVQLRRSRSWSRPSQTSSGSWAPIIPALWAAATVSRVLTRRQGVQPRRSRYTSRPSPTTSESWAPTTPAPWAPATISPRPTIVPGD